MASKRTWTIGMKIAAGFIALIVIALVLGGLAVWSMKGVEGESTKLAQEYVPEVEVANNIERYSLLTMYGMRGYGLSENEKYLKDAQDNLAEIKHWLKEANDLADRSEHLVKLKSSVGEVENSVNEYEGLVEKTVKRTTAINENRGQLDAAAVKYMQNCIDFLDGQNAKMKKEIKAGLAAPKLEERLEKITIVNDIIDLGNSVRVACFKSQATRDPELIRATTDKFEEMNQKFEALRAITREDEDIERINKTKEAANAYKTAMFALLDNWEALTDLGKQRDSAGEAVLTGAQGTAMKGLKETDRIAKGAQDSLGTASTIMIVGLCVAMVLGIALAYVIGRAIKKALTRIAASLAEGAEQVASASGQVSSASQSLAEGASEQAASIEETSSSIEEMASMTKQNASNANEANALSGEARSSAEKGAEAMERMSKAIDDIKNSSDETAKIVKTIDEIAFQTNLLALNAAVEAARAGEAGKGFAVVAEEVRNLAQRSAEAAKNTAEMIEEAVGNAERGVNISSEVAQALSEISEGATKVNNLVGEIAAASQEQSQGIDQVNVAVNQMDKVTQSNAANAEETASAAEELSAQAEELNRNVAELQTMVLGSSAEGNAKMSKAHYTHQKSRPAPRVRKVEAPKPTPPQTHAQQNEQAIPLEDDSKELANF